jgi:hypothetical protein
MLLHKLVAVADAFSDMVNIHVLLVSALRD